MKKVLYRVLESWKEVPLIMKNYYKFQVKEKELYEKNNIELPRHLFHDVDNILLHIIIPWKGKDWINNYHEIRSSHHPPIGIEKIDWIETIIDWECQCKTKEKIKKYFFIGAIRAMEKLGL